MLRWIKGGRSDHPLDDAEASSVLLEQVSGKDPIPALENISAHLDAIKTADNLRPARAYEIVDLLDRTGRPLQRRLNQEYVVEGQRLTRFQQARVWSSLYNYWTQLAEGYRFCLAKYEVGAVGAAALKPQLARITCRGLRACTGQLKWTLLRYGPVERRVWQDIGALYLLAETMQFASVRLGVYRGAKGESSAEREFVHALMLAMSSADGLLPQQIDIADRLIVHLLEYFRVARSSSKGLHWVFDLSGERPPGRPLGDSASKLGSRYFGPGEATTQLDRFAHALRAREALPAEVSLGSSSGSALIQATVQHLQRYWAPRPPERKDRRRRHLERISVVHEFEEVVANVGGLFLESPFVSNDEEWIVENESESGFGAVVPQPNGSWLKVGDLIGVRREDGVAWGAGIVRRVTVDDKGIRNVGIQMLASGGAAVTVLSTTPGNRDTSVAADGEVCVLLPSGNLQTGEATLLMRAGLFSTSQDLLMRAYDRQYHLFPLSLTERGKEFDIGRYRILEQVQ
ncbi:MAG: hypothetical protein C5B46_02385 [Proteobacteria bacterium]|nr:MAG: hypothetical protein C5B46_02385 [Pseudomonadota bacterium]